MPRTVKRCLFRGDTRPIQLQVTNPYTGAIIDPTGAQLFFTARRGMSDDPDEVVFQKTETNGITIADASLGIIDVQAEPADTASLGPFSTILYYDAAVITAGGAKYTYESGPLHVLANATV